MRRLFLVAVVGVAVVVGVSGAAGSPATAESRWVIGSLGTLGGSYSAAFAINERGQVVGTSQTVAGMRHVFLWANGRMTDLGRYNGDGPLLLNELGQVAWDEPGRGNPDGVHTEGRAVLWKDGVTTTLGLFNIEGMNDRGQIVGGILAANGDYHAALWENGRVRDLGTLPGGGHSFTAAINGKGHIVGSSETGGKDKDGNSIRHAVMWREGKVRDLGVLPGLAPGSTNCEAASVNDRGQVLGTCHPASGLRIQWSAFLWENGRMRDLGPFPGQPTLLNERGQVAGFSSYHAFFWADGKITYLGNLGGKGTDAFALNDKGQVVGESRVKSGAFHGFVWENGKMTDLGTLPGGRSSYTSAINNKGQIVGGSVERGYNAPSRAVLWTLRSG